MSSDDIILYSGADISSLLVGRELIILEAVKNAYIAHSIGESSLPHSTFLRFPDNYKDRIIALPAYLGNGINIAGVKWIASFPNNIELGLDRASAVIILNSMQTGRAEAILEGATISAKRTAASAALAASYLHNCESTSVGIVGCGLINFETIRFLSFIYKNISKLVIYDLNESRALNFMKRCKYFMKDIEMEVTRDLNTVLSSSSLISIATTAQHPYILDLSPCIPGSTILHISLRDLSSDAILDADNVVDDIDHVCKAETSVHMAEIKAGNRMFIRGTLAEVMTGMAGAKVNANAVTVFSPFGLGILDLSVADLICKLGIKAGKGTVLNSFFPTSWNKSVIEHD